VRLLNESVETMNRFNDHADQSSRASAQRDDLLTPPKAIGWKPERELHAAAKSHSLIAKVHERGGSVQA